MHFPCITRRGPISLRWFYAFTRLVFYNSFRKANNRISKILIPRLEVQSGNEKVSRQKSKPWLLSVSKFYCTFLNDLKVGRTIFSAPVFIIEFSFQIAIFKMFHWFSIQQENVSTNFQNMFKFFVPIDGLTFHVIRINPEGSKKLDCFQKTSTMFSNWREIRLCLLYRRLTVEIERFIFTDIYNSVWKFHLLILKCVKNLTICDHD